MRWPWSRRAAGQLDPPPTTPQSPADQPPSPMGWAFLPPIQRTLETPISPVTRPTSFPVDLPAWRSPAFTGALSHAVLDTVPGGVIDGDGAGLATPTHTAGPGPELTLLPPPRPTAVQRAATAGRSPREAPTTPAAIAKLPAAPAADAPTPPDLDDGAAVAAEEAAATTVSLSSSEPAVRPDPPAMPLTRAASAGLPVVHRAVVADPPSRPAADPVAASGDAVAADVPVRPPLGQIPSAPDPSGGAAAVQRATDRVAPVPTPAARPRLGLGPPLPSAPDTAVPVPPAEYDDGAPPRPTEAEPGTDPAPSVDGRVTGDVGYTEVSIQRTATAAGPQPPLRGTPPDRVVVAPADRSSPRLTLARSIDPGARPPAEQSAAATPSDPPRATPSEPPSDLSAGPVVADRTTVEPAAPPADLGTAAPPDPDVDAARPEAGVEPEPAAVEPPLALLPSTPLPLAGGIATSIQRAALLSGPVAPTPSLVVRPAPLVPPAPPRQRVVPVQRLTVGTEAAESALGNGPPTPSRHVSVRADPPGAPSAVPVQRSVSSYDAAPAAAPASAPRPARLGPPPSASARPDAGPVVARTVATPGPAVAAPGPATTVVPSVPVSPPPAPTVPPPALPLASPPGPAASAVVVQTALDDAAPTAGGGPSVAPDPMSRHDGAGSPPGPVTVQAEAATPAPAAGAPGASGAGGTPAGGAGSATGDVDALAQRLFPAVLRRIKAELLLDRERRGVRTDPW